MLSQNGPPNLGSLARMTHASIHLDFSDPDMAQALADSAPPDGVKVSGPFTFIQASAPAQIVTQIIIEFLPQFSATLLAGWILLALEKRRQKRTRINRKEVALKEADIVRLIQDELAKQKARDAQWREEHRKKGRRRTGGRAPRSTAQRLDENRESHLRQASSPRARR